MCDDAIEHFIAHIHCQIEFKRIKVHVVRQKHGIKVPLALIGHRNRYKDNDADE